ncbi:MAG: SDR family oxidoreductase [Deltaproteobacteria bacterium]|nr:SDR family oxidoreductase [Deltaproteobacteria bacterium]
MQDPKHIAITGASGGLGRALALAYALPGTVLSLSGRNGAELSETARLARLRGAECFEALFDARDGEALSGWVAGSDRRAPLDLVIANAGICRGLGPEGLEAPWDVVETLRVNAEGTILTALFAARIMRARGRGQIAVISSQAGKAPLIYTPGYSASKAAARSYALSLREGMAPFGVEVSCVCPGYIASPMQATFRGGVFGAWTAERAAARIARKLRGNPREIGFPVLMSLLAGAFPLAPCPLKPWLLRRFSFRVEPAGEAGGEVRAPAVQGSPAGAADGADGGAGRSSAGGSPAGGSASGGSAAGETASGGSAAGGSSAGGSPAGGTASGGSAARESAVGGTAADGGEDGLSRGAACGLGDRPDAE